MAQHLQDSTGLVDLKGAINLCDDLLLLEMNDEIAQSWANDSLTYFVGEESQEAVFCTTTSTFKMRFVETSNTMLLVPPFEGNEAFILGAVNRHCEVRKVDTDPSELKKILANYIYNPVDPEKNKGIKIEELQKRYQGSLREIQQGLEAINALNINDKWLLIQENVINQTLSRILDGIIENNWNINQLIEQEIIEFLDNPDPVVIHYCLDIFGKEIQPKCFLLQISHIARFRAHEIFKLKGSCIFVDEFMIEWAGTLPGCHQPESDWLKGIALQEIVNGVTCFVYFPENTLPLNLEDRFEILFKKKNRWFHHEIEVYLSSILDNNPNQSITNILLKYCRESVDPQTNQKVYALR